MILERKVTCAHSTILIQETNFEGSGLKSFRHPDSNCVGSGLLHLAYMHYLSWSNFLKSQYSPDMARYERDGSRGFCFSTVQKTWNKPGSVRVSSIFLVKQQDSEALCNVNYVINSKAKKGRVQSPSQGPNQNRPHHENVGLLLLQP